MADPEVPPLELPELTPDNALEAKRQQAAEYELLKHEARLKRYAAAEAGQRYTLRWIAAGSGLLVIVGMSCLLFHIIHRVFLGPFLFVNSAFSVAMIVAPVFSITAISVALFVGAFRKFEDKDMEGVGSGLSNGVNMLRGQ